ncbi:hypothetical protein CPAR01_15283 [Colletotrichum paranaense]|uniref:Uncharacterized protein n=1 Tax=Colletotrichum paranaense TaxID=1914294 RepID=A0ABQ9S0I9_9PEZI|nr:uncharacterized protein CPAR01_15283 [Colletotrichum paranaense]KAK1520232.1 hypothetical protein CPAR01_15283 [Colletotrichum paranaense]
MPLLVPSSSVGYYRHQPARMSKPELTALTTASRPGQHGQPGDGATWVSLDLVEPRRPRLSLSSSNLVSWLQLHYAHRVAYASSSDFESTIAPLAAVSPFGRDEVVHLYTPQDSSYTSVLTYPIELSSSHSLSSRFFPTVRLHLQDRLPSYHTLGVLVLYTLPKVLLHGSGRGWSAVHMAQDYCKPQ